MRRSAVLLQRMFTSHHWVKIDYLPCVSGLNFIARQEDMTRVDAPACLH